MTRIDGAHAVVTGGSSGIGLATARELLLRGARVSLVARRRDALESAAGSLRSLGRGRVCLAPADVGERANLESALAALATEQGPCDVLVTSAGAIRPGYFADLSDSEPDAFEAMLRVNYYGTLHAVRAVVPGMVARKGGSIVGVSSTAAFLGVFGYTAYSASKFAVRGLLESLRAELAPHGVHVGIAYPPDTDTPGLAEEERWKPREAKAVTGAIPPLSAERVARSVVDGIERDKTRIFCDFRTRALAALAGLGHGLVESKMDSIVRKAGKANELGRSQTK